MAAQGNDRFSHGRQTKPADPGEPSGAKRWMGSLGQAGRYLGQSLRLMVGMPDYDNYLNHMERTHPDQEPMSYEAFFRERLEARYGGAAGKCC